jgi:predicted metal-binding membrane protein
MTAPDRYARRQRIRGLVVLAVLAVLVLVAWGIPLARWLDAPSPPPGDPFLIPVTPVPALTSTPLHPSPSP